MPTFPELLILRHGETAWNAEGRWQGALDSPLTPLGLDQARAMAALLSGLGIGPATHDLRTSPQGRALTTAEAVAAATGLSPVPDPRLREIGVGRWAGLTRAEADALSPPPAPDEHFLDRYARAPEGEGFAALWERCAAVLADLRRPTVIVTHGITSRVLRTIATGRTPDRLADLPGGQGVIFRIAAGRHETLAPPDLARQAPSV
ncbi:histidine phosphatase family protein [Histidinibacterium lentulum]|uniref:Histidine phosphatase family protein n=1 Tax=Histidinibacterium lentulum TaxID=2480588 RepID=A0A3N2R926_9RHOB|nr:histidine phosphatase family protein [Histidinibacterium lentulum]ROU03935.1 histidine phosphatase family protein [Histidinibacterium lentulum]